MSPRNCRRAVLASVLGAVAIVGAASMAWACTTFAKIDLSVSSGVPGTAILVTGENAAPNGQVALRWDSRTAPQVATAVTDADGKFAASVKAPDAVGGVHVLLATDSKGHIARGAFEIAGGAAVAGAADAGFRTASTPVQSTDWLRFGANLLGFGMAAAVAVLGALVLRRRPVPVAAPVRSRVAED